MKLSQMNFILKDCPLTTLGICTDTVMMVSIDSVVFIGGFLFESHI